MTEEEPTDISGGQSKRLPGYTQMHNRNREIGALLKQARLTRDESTEAVAKLIGTSRRRYAAMERGEALIGAVELEMLRQHFGIPATRLWGVNGEGDGQGKVGKRSRGKASRAQMEAETTVEPGALDTPAARLVLVEVTPGEEILIRTKAQ